MDIEYHPERIITYYVVVKDIYNVLIEQINNKDLVMIIINMTTFPMPNNDLGWESEESNEESNEE